MAGRIPVTAAIALGVLSLSAIACDAQNVVTALDAWGDIDNALHVRWITAPGDPSKGQVEYGPTAALGSVVEEDPGCLRGATNNRDSGAGWANNHRADIPDIAAWPVHLRIGGQTRAGEEFRTETIIIQAPIQPVGRTRRATIPITIHPGDWELAKLPITLGVPFPKGELADPGNVRILIGDSEIPSQAKVVTRWREDSTIKWLRVDFLAPNGAEAAILEYGTQVTRRVRTPAWDFHAHVSLHLVTTRLTDADGKPHHARIEEEALEEAGPVKWVQRLRGSYVADDGASLCGFAMRLHCWGVEEPELIQLEYTFENDNIDSEFTRLRSLELLIRDTALQQLAVGVGDQQVVLYPQERVWQREDFEWVTEPPGPTGKRLQGVVDLGDLGPVVIRNFWQQWPISVELREEGALIGLLPVLPEGFYANRKDEDKLYYQIRDGLHTFREGFTKTWELWLADSERPGEESLVGERPIASLPPEWIEDTGVLQKLAVSVRDQFPGYDEALAKGIDRYLAARDRAREYGMMNFGDWHGERTWNWGNLEYDLGHGFLTQFVRSQKPEFFRRAEEVLRHQRDVDTRHYAADPRRVGQQWTHCIGHTAGYYPKEYKDMKVYATPGWSDNRGHVWAQGMFEHFLLGGDARSWETALLIADNFAGPGMTNYRFGNAREPGWITKLAMSAYLATEDTFYLNAARIMLDAVRERSLATGDHGFNYHKLYGGHCRCPDDEKHYGEAGFMLGVQMTGMRMYYDATGDERVADDIVKIAEFIVDSMWVPEQFGFRYTSCPKTGIAGGSAWIMMDGLAFAARRSGDEKLADVCRRALVSAWRNLPTSGKSAGYVLCSSAQALEQMAHLPGQSFAQVRAVIEQALKSPARRLLPTNVPNPDFETDILGWPSRGWAVERVTDIKHSGEACLKISGKLAGANEYVNTTYGSTGSPREITWLKPKATYRLTAWVRVDSLSEGAPPPSVRIQLRDDDGSRTSKSTNAYDPSKLGTWQKLTVDAEIPEWNTRNYIALNTCSRDEMEVEMYFDDISLVPVELARLDQYAYHRLEPSGATLTAGAKLEPDPNLPGEMRLSGPGSAEWEVDIAAAGEYVLWAKLEGGAAAGEARIGGTALRPIAPPEESTWARLGQAQLGTGPVAISLGGLPGGPQVGALILTDDPSSSL